MSKPDAPTQQQTIDALLDRSKRRSGAVPIRRAFLQQGTQAHPEPGPLAALVRRGDERSLDLYLLLLATASAEPWDVTVPSPVWARTLGLHGEASASQVSKVWRRLEDRQLVSRARRGRRAEVTLLREDGSGTAYSHPGEASDRTPYLKLPLAYWTATEVWYRRLHLSAKAMLLIGLSLPVDFILPYKKAEIWYGLSSATAERGLRQLQKVELVKMRKEFKPAPLTAVGYTEQRRYTLLSPFTARRRPKQEERNIVRFGRAS